MDMTRRLLALSPSLPARPTSLSPFPSSPRSSASGPPQPPAQQPAPPSLSAPLTAGPHRSARLPPEPLTPRARAPTRARTRARVRVAQDSVPRRHALPLARTPRCLPSSYLSAANPSTEPYIAPPPPNPSRAAELPTRRLATPFFARFRGARRATPPSLSRSVALTRARRRSPRHRRPNLEKNPQNEFSISSSLSPGPNVARFAQRRRASGEAPPSAAAPRRPKSPNQPEPSDLDPTAQIKPESIRRDPVPEEQVQQQFAEEGKYNTDNP
nr:unnamed protein product [Digitaria exilis]